MLSRYLKVLIVSILLTNTAFAQPPGKGPKVKAQKFKPAPSSRTVRGRFSCVNRRGETVIFVGTSSDIPPGLRCRAMPYGLEKKGKTPAGWGKGQKRGW